MFIIGTVSNERLPQFLGTDTISEEQTETLLWSILIRESRTDYHFRTVHTGCLPNKYMDIPHRFLVKRTHTAFLKLAFSLKVEEDWEATTQQRNLKNSHVTAPTEMSLTTGMRNLKPKSWLRNFRTWTEGQGTLDQDTAKLNQSLGLQNNQQLSELLIRF